MNALFRPYRALLAFAVFLMMSSVAVTALAEPVCYRLPFPNPNLGDGFGSRTGRSNPHRGVDFPQPQGKAIPAVADGVVANIAFNGCLGNNIVIRHADGVFSGYSHMVTRTPLQIGQSVTAGQTIGYVGRTGTCATGPHLHLSMGPTATSFAAGAVFDPYAYIVSHKECSCDRSGGGLTFSCDGPNPGKTCVSVNEPEDKAGWADNFLCSDANLGLEFSAAGPIKGKRCTYVSDAAEPHAGWANNYICVDQEAPVALSWSSGGPIKGKDCVNWNEPGDAAGSWQDNYLCVDPKLDFVQDIFTFSADGAQSATQSCVSVGDPDDPNGWKDNFFCSTKDIGMQYSFAGPIAGMRCTNTAEPGEHNPEVWADNYLCLPEDSSYYFQWSAAGPIEGQACIRWYEPGDPKGSWEDDYVCVTYAGSSSALNPLSADPEGGGDVLEQEEDLDLADFDQGGCSTARSTNSSSHTFSKSKSPASGGVLVVALGVLASVVVRRKRSR